MSRYVVPYTDLGMRDIERVGGKNASLGEMISNLSRLGCVFRTKLTADSV